MTSFVPLLLSTLAFTVVPEDPAQRVPASSLVYVEVAGPARAREVLADTHAAALWNEPELQAFLAPILEGMDADLAFVTRDLPDGLREFDLASVRRWWFALVDLVEPEDEGDDPRLELAFAAEGVDGEEILEWLLDWSRDEDVEFARIELEGRDALRVESGDDDDPTVHFVADGDALIVHVADTGADPATIGRPAESLADDVDFTAARAGAGVGADDALVFAYGRFHAAMERAFSVMPDETFGDEDEAAFLERVMLESPGVEGLRGAAVGITADGAALRDRVYLHAPGDRSGWGVTGPVGDAPARHAALADPEAQVFFTTFFDLEDAFARRDTERERVEALAREYDVDLDEAEDGDPIGQMLEAFEASTDVDLLELLLPALGNRLSMFVSLPDSAFAIPDAGVVVDLADAEAFVDLLDVLVLLDDRIDEANFEWDSHGDHRLLTMKLVGAGLPVVPTFVVVDDLLLVSTSPMSARTVLDAAAAGTTLAGDARVAAFVADTPTDRNTVAWTDMGACFEYLYGFIGIGMSAMRASGADLGERFDPALLPSGPMVARHLGIGTIEAWEDEQGGTLEGRSTLGNPLTGTLSGVVGVLALIGGSEGLREKADEQRREATSENMTELARALEAYKGSVGGGQYPQDLIRLVDRGLLTDRDLLVDPSDPSPKRTRAGNGERIPVSYALASVDALPAEVRERIGAGHDTILTTRGAWHDDQRLAIVLGDTDHVHVYSDGAD